jgi:hypothetical protein
MIANAWGGGMGSITPQQNVIGMMIVVDLFDAKVFRHLSFDDKKT